MLYTHCRVGGGQLFDKCITKQVLHSPQVSLGSILLAQSVAYISLHDLLLSFCPLPSSPCPVCCCVPCFLPNLSHVRDRGRLVHFWYTGHRLAFPSIENSLTVMYSYIGQTVLRWTVEKTMCSVAFLVFEFQENFFKIVFLF